MSEVNVKFIFEGREMMVKCNKDEKLKNICERYSIKLGINQNLLVFLYEGKQINSELCFESQASTMDKSNKEMNILVIRNENDELKCPKYFEKIKLNKEKIEEIILSNHKLKDSINGISVTIDSMIKASPNDSKNFQLKNINKILNLIYDELKKNIEKIENLLNDSLSINENKKPPIPAYIEDNNIKIKFDTKKIDKILYIKDSTFINIDNIIIKNIGKKTYKNLYFSKDDINSSKEFIFFSNSKNSNEYELHLKGELKPNDTYNTHTTLRIENAKPEQTYKMVIFIKERNENNNLSEPLEINIKIKKEQEQEKIDKAKKLLYELKVDGLNINEIIEVIIEKNFDYIDIKDWVEEKKRTKAEQIYNELIKFDDVDFFNSSKDKILNQIIDLLFNIDNIRYFYSKDEVTRKYARLEYKYSKIKCNC